MRKHFLILMLMALLPLAGYADDLHEGKMVIPSTYYGYAPNWTVDDPYEIKVYNKVNKQLKKDVDFTIEGDGFYSDADCTQKLTIAEVKAKNAGTIVYVKVTGIAAYENPLKASFEIKKMPLILSGTPGWKVYNNDPTKDGTLFTFKSTTSGSTTTVAADAVKEGYGTSPANLVGATAKFGTDPASIITFTRAAGEDKGNKALTAKIENETLAKNYTIASEDIKTIEATPAQAFYSITAKDFTVDVTSAGTTTPGTVEITINDSGDNVITYTGYAQYPTFKVVDKALNKELVQNTDYTIDWKDASDNVDACKIAGIHNIRFTGKGNYDTSDKVQKTFTINPAILLVKPVAIKTYDGANTLPDAPTSANDNETAWHPTTSGAVVTSHFEFQGFVDGKNAADVTFNTTDATEGTEAPAWTWNNAADATANANAENTTYALKIANENVNKAFKLDNYTFKAQKGTYTIKKKDLTANVKEDALNYGEEKTFTLVDAGTTTGTDAGLTGAIAADFAALRNAIKVTQAETAETTGANAGQYKLYAEWRTDDEIAAWVNANATAGTSAADIATAIANAKTAQGNYNLNKDASFNWLTFNNADLTIALDLSKYKLEKVYDGKKIEVTLDKENGLIIDGKVKESDVVNLDNLKLEVVGANTGAYQATPYVLRLSGATAKGYNIHYVAAQYIIKQRPLKVKAFDQVFVKGQVQKLNGSLYQIDPTTPLAETDAADKVFKLSTDVQFNATTGVVESNVSDPTASTPVTYSIDVVDCAIAGQTKWANYDVTVTKGVATVIAAGALTLDDSKDMKAALVAAVTPATGSTTVAPATVSFAPRNVAAESWNVLVLPFDITVSELSRAFGYAVVDVMDETASDGNVHFNLYMGTIKANTPFMFKLDGEYNNLNQIYFLNKTIVYDLTNADEDAVKLDATGNSYITDKAGNKLIGTYHSTAINKGEYYLGNVSETPGVVVPGWKPAEANANPIKGERAILVMAAANGARQILVEEPDGTTTAIDVIAAEKVNTVKEGWYTLNGVKLQGVPTQKGIYINNGKKVVVK